MHGCRDLSQLQYDYCHFSGADSADQGPQLNVPFRHDLPSYKQNNCSQFELILGEICACIHTYK